MCACSSVKASSVQPGKWLKGSRGGAGHEALDFDPDGFGAAQLDAGERVDATGADGRHDDGLADALELHGDQVKALGGTVTATTSVRYGDISGPARAHQLELRASWTATTLALGSHVQAFCEVLEHAAGLPPAGVTDLSSRSRA